MLNRKIDQYAPTILQAAVFTLSCKHAHIALHGNAQAYAIIEFE
jgi:hypothetical protein